MGLLSYTLPIVYRKIIPVPPENFCFHCLLASLAATLLLAPMSEQSSPPLKVQEHRHKLVSCRPSYAGRYLPSLSLQYFRPLVKKTTIHMHSRWTTLSIIL